ncbi:non-oxidative hydroxyarylic acid decarboxylases subunit D [Saccharopolyspora oryzae]|uniref:Non-oxidative hydroxyarylic acid decarboxylases subunit D n=1 Tax=Saccharopolyspora oryzae TaxID=2997343 RepID=A0ABT4V1W7_9PSEU|nr:non-oxidative hydroxyarylic acid decarboxylases subunit D [Saccharopolyspora oryzae]MDA3627949.1 non-oxidative hydroxyarylic acid decarboxylases subunit D [Saccharopolyspora oryzae]
MTTENAAPTECPRCGHTALDLLHTSPVAGCWEVYQCEQCLYCWRTSEPARRTRRDAYPESFKLTVDDIRNAPEVPTIPPLRAQA